MKRCMCGRAYSRDSWSGLALVGYMGKGYEVAGELLELRNCARCGSSLAVDCGEVPDGPPSLAQARAS